MTNIPFDENLEITKDLPWSILKYGLCSYFTLAYANKYSDYQRFLAVMEYDEEIKKEYLVHFLIISGDKFIDAYGTYNNWKESVKDMTDVGFMELTAKEVDNKFVVQIIEEDMGFDKDLYNKIENFVNTAY